MTAATGRERRQFRALVRLFAYRFFDTDIVSVRGDLSALLSQFAALLAALSLVLVLMTGGKYAGLYQHLTAEQLHTAAWADQEFLISTSMAIIGVFTLFLWDALFPDRRDCMILGALPVRIRVVFAAKLAALGAALGLAVLAVNSFTGLVCPFLIVPGASGIFDAARDFAAFWLVIVMASAFVFLLLLGVQGVSLDLLTHARYMRWSSLIQTAAFFAVLTLYFLTPPLAHPHALAAPENRLWFTLVPSYWFFGLFQVLTGSKDAVFGWLARRALAGFGCTVLVAALAYSLAYVRQMRRAVEQSGIAPRAAPSGSGRPSPVYSPAARRNGAFWCSSDARCRAAGSIACCWRSMRAWGWHTSSARRRMCCIISGRRISARSKAARKRRWESRSSCSFS